VLPPPPAPTFLLPPAPAPPSAGAAPPEVPVIPETESGALLAGALAALGALAAWRGRRR
jgi:MYXO-CTERM domain-containing protein